MSVSAQSNSTQYRQDLYLYEGLSVGVAAPFKDGSLLFVIAIIEHMFVFVNNIYLISCTIYRSYFLKHLLSFFLKSKSFLYLTFHIIIVTSLEYTAYRVNPCSNQSYRFDCPFNRTFGKSPDRTLASYIKLLKDQRLFYSYRQKF